MPVTTSLRPWNPPDLTEIEKALAPQTELAALTTLTDAQLAAALERRYFAPQGAERAPIALTVDGTPVHALVAPNLQPGERGAALLKTLISQISAPRRAKARRGAARHRLRSGP